MIVGTIVVFDGGSSLSLGVRTLVLKGKLLIRGAKVLSIISLLLGGFLQQESSEET